jgi:hypothetical protein
LLQTVESDVAAPVFKVKTRASLMGKGQGLPCGEAFRLSVDPHMHPSTGAE